MPQPIIDQSQLIGHSIEACNYSRAIRAAMRAQGLDDTFRDRDIYENCREFKRRYPHAPADLVDKYLHHITEIERLTALWIKGPQPHASTKTPG